MKISYLLHCIIDSFPQILKCKIIISKLVLLAARGQRPRIILGTFKILIGWFILLSVQTFQPLIVIYRIGNFVYPHQRCTSIYEPWSYPFRSLRRQSYLSPFLEQACPSFLHTPRSPVISFRQIIPAHIMTLRSAGKCHL